MDFNVVFPNNANFCKFFFFYIASSLASYSSSYSDTNSVIEIPTASQPNWAPKTGKVSL